MASRDYSTFCHSVTTMMSGRKRVTYPFFLGYDDEAAQRSASEATAGLIYSPYQLLLPGLFALSCAPPARATRDVDVKFSRRVFIGGLQPNVSEVEIMAVFRKFGEVIVSWPEKVFGGSPYPPKGYAFLIFEDEDSVPLLMAACLCLGSSFLYFMSPIDYRNKLSYSRKAKRNKPVQVRAWRLGDSDFVFDTFMPLEARKTIFLGGVPPQMKAVELASAMNRLYGGVCYAGIDVDTRFSYPKGSGRVAFSSDQAYIDALMTRFIEFRRGKYIKRVEVKPFILDDQVCDGCHGELCFENFAPYFCTDLSCLEYYCEICWEIVHSAPGKNNHKKVTKDFRLAKSPCVVSYLWC